MSTTILVIEDNATNLELMVYLLEAYGYQLIACSKGEQGTEIAIRELPDLIICDIQIPGMNGYQVMNQLKNDPRTNHIPIIAVTAYAMVGNRDSFLDSGFDGYISKPIISETFVSQIEEFLPSEKRTHLIPTRYETKFSEPESAPIENKGTILVVDDSSINQDLVKSTLQPYGYRLLLASNVQEAFSILRKTVPDLIISDIHMPYTTGYEFLREVKNLESLKTIPFLIITSSTNGDQDRSYCLGLGAKAFVTRPIEPRALVKLVSECFE